MVEFLIKPDSLYAAVYDQASIENKPRLFKTLMKQAEKAARKNGEEWATLWYLNSLLVELGKDEQILSWLFLFPGIYKIRMKYFQDSVDEIDQRYEKDKFMGESNFLYCPSGKIIISCFAEIGNRALQPIFTVAPGIYTLSLWCNRHEEDKHTFLEDFSHYPNYDGPDWLILLSSV